MAGTIRVSSEHKGDSLTLHFTGDRIQNVNAKLFEQCAGQLMACAAKNACLDEGLRITEPCFRVVADHDKKAECLPSGLGFAHAAGG